MDIEGGLKAGALSVLVDCRGAGKLTVRVEPVGLNFPMTCAAGEVSSVHNQVEVGHPRPRGTVSVTASSGVRWAITVGQ
ncbi:hypothetical protein JK359_07400 [Streptomyces actinomycinicus]|uniref:Uncharacterized protein n=2 Tax=Streptomyces actinomycinicus TaxID=1695166 RepID=A0A937JNU9_9ACTN|nr:hypothetical protein [Streptomyces actinomycinicus]